MACSIYELLYGGTAGAGNGVLQVTYRNCGDNTLFTIDETGGLSGASYGVIIATVGSLTTTTGFASAGGTPVPGFVYTTKLAPWSTYVAVSAGGGQQFRQGT